MEQLCENFELCPKYCHLQSNVGSCFHFQLKQCKGICRNQEAIEDYNNRVLDAISSMKYKRESFVIIDKGRNSKEVSFVLIEIINSTLC